MNVRTEKSVFLVHKHHAHLLKLLFIVTNLYMMICVLLSVGLDVHSNSSWTLRCHYTCFIRFPPKRHILIFIRFTLMCHIVGWPEKVSSPETDPKRWCRTSCPTLRLRKRSLDTGVSITGPSYTYHPFQPWCRNEVGPVFHLSFVR